MDALRAVANRLKLQQAPALPPTRRHITINSPLHFRGLRLETADQSERAPATLVGRGRVGGSIARILGDDLRVTISRNTGSIPDDGEGPIYVCTTNDALDDVLRRTPNSRHRDLVLLQNGWLLPWLDRNRLEDVTLVALYMAAAPDGAVTDGLRTVVHGRWADHVAQTLARGGVTCRVVDGATLYRALVEKMLWACIFWLLSAALEGATVGDIASKHRQHVEDLVEELQPLLMERLRACEDRPAAVEAAETLEKHGSVVDALLEYSQSIAHAVPSKQMAMEEFAWRNGALLQIRGTSLHCQWLQRAGVDVTAMQL